MNTQQINYERIATAIDFIRNNFKDQPDLDKVASEIHLSPFHFQKMFSEWAGVSPKKFLQYLTVEHAKNILRQNKATNADIAFETGLSGTGRLHDLFVSIEGMTPGEYKNGGQDLIINYSFAESPFGQILVASTSKGICYMAFVAHDAQALESLKNKFPNASYRQVVDEHQQNALFIFRQDWKGLQKIKLHLKGSPFQLKVWETLLRIPFGNLDTYGGIARQIQNESASRAVGTAVGDNPVAYLIPCHRVIQAAGKMGGYHWGTNRKAAIIGWEAAQLEQKAS
ncbi:bifunctional helix-turn-helix domain-containing protein/methylated-DNA--[protein]-cysteine S-methyltransferase [Flavitalea sp.]|nr:methylated-DNA--[protein]-cysteine S-methyltransferase [Flavitalea sp.]